MNSLIVMTYNVGNGRARPDRLVQVLRASGADLVGLQELCAAQAEALAAQLSDEYPHQSLYPDGFAGKALLSRFPLLEAEQIHLYPGRPDLHATVDIASIQLQIIIAHPPPPVLGRSGFQFNLLTRRQLETLVDLTVRRQPAILLADLNLTSYQREYATLRAAGLRDAFLEVGNGKGNTLPRRLGPWKRFLRLNRLLSWLPMFPLLRVDYILYTGQLAATECWVGEDAGSDHLPVLARLAFNGTKPQIAITRPQVRPLPPVR
jgi:endonuclease/exonuclease/phosphatase family metal-dependent hydrolase